MSPYETYPGDLIIFDHDQRFWESPRFLSQGKITNIIPKNTICMVIGVGTTPPWVNLFAANGEHGWLPISDKIKNVCNR